jgi:hypothetical protein
MDATAAILDEMSFIVKHTDTNPAVPVLEKAQRINKPATKNYEEFVPFVARAFSPSWIHGPASGTPISAPAVLLPEASGVSVSPQRFKTRKPRKSRF